VLVGILNVTPDSFSDGGQLPTPQAAAEHARRLVNDGADVLDIGGESTRPGAVRVSIEEQITRTVPAIEAIHRAGIGVPLTIDTTRAEVARAALEAGADAVNDVSGGTEDEGMLPLVAARSSGIILMHRLAPPDQDVYSTEYQSEPVYEGGVIEHVVRSIGSLVDDALRNGIAAESVLVDPGLGFGKSVTQNLRLLRAADRFQSLGAGVMIGTSRKSFLGGPSPEERDAASVGAAAAAMACGARCFRVHNVRIHREALNVLDQTLTRRPWNNHADEHG